MNNKHSGSSKDDKKSDRCSRQDLYPPSQNGTKHVISLLRGRDLGIMSSVQPNNVNA